MGDSFGADEPSRYVTGHMDQLSLAIPPWVGALSTGVGYDGRYREENGEFCRVLHVSRPCDQKTAGVLTQLVEGAAC